MESLRTDDAEAHDADRALRDELERLQAELRRTRETLANEKAREPEQEAELRAALEAAAARRDTGRARLASLTTEAERLEGSCASLDAQVAAKRQEDEVLARGAQRRDTYTEWFQQGDQLPWNAPRNVLFLALFFLLVALGYLALGLR